MRRPAALVGIVVLVATGCTGESATSRGATEQNEGNERSEGSSDDVEALAECEGAGDRALCLVQALDGPTEKEPLLALINAHEELGNPERAGRLKARYVALFDDATASLFARDLPAEGGEEADEAPRVQAPPAEGAEDFDEGEAPLPTEGGSMQMANPLLDCAAEANYNACIMRNMTRPSTPREYEALINAYKQTGQRQRACTLMEEVIERYPSSPAARRFGMFVQSNCG